MADQTTKVLCLRFIQKKEENSNGKKDKWSELRRRGQLSVNLLPEIWPNLERRERQFVLFYMMYLGHACILHDPNLDSIGQTTFLVPSLLPRLSATSLVIWNVIAMHDCDLRMNFITAHSTVNGD